MAKKKKCQCGKVRPEFVFGPDGRCDRCRQSDPKPARTESEKDERAWNGVRAKRQKLLSACDWTQLPDVPQAVSLPWKDYRQKLRDITDADDPNEIVWPEKPT